MEKAQQDQKKVQMICNKLLEQGVIENVDNKTFFVQNDLYKFYFDKQNIADNMMRNWR